MSVFMWIGLMLQKLFLLPKFLFLILKDKIRYYIEKGWLIFEGWGLHIYVGVFGGGKTSTAVFDAYNLAQKYKCLHILTNLKLVNFPKHTEILKLTSPKDILNAPRNTLVLIDEIGTIFNSRDFSKSKESVPKILFQHLCQCRKRRLMIYATSQRWCFVDKQLRDITATVRTTRMAFAHPFSRMATVKTYDSVEYDMFYTNPMYPLKALSARAYVQTDRLRDMYDTEELIDNMLSKKYVSDEEILANQGFNVDLNEITKDGKKTLKKNSHV